MSNTSDSEGDKKPRLSLKPKGASEGASPAAPAATKPATGAAPPKLAPKAKPAAPEPPAPEAAEARDILDMDIPSMPEKPSLAPPPPPIKTLAGTQSPFGPPSDAEMGIVDDVPLADPEAPRLNLKKMEPPPGDTSLPPAPPAPAGALEPATAGPGSPPPKKAKVPPGVKLAPAGEEPPAPTKSKVIKIALIFFGAAAVLLVAAVLLLGVLLGDKPPPPAAPVEEPAVAEEEAPAAPTETAPLPTAPGEEFTDLVAVDVKPAAPEAPPPGRDGPGEANPEVQAYVDALPIEFLNIDPQAPVLLLGPVAYPVGSLLDPPLGLHFAGLEANGTQLVFRDTHGHLYRRNR